MTPVSRGCVQRLSILLESRRSEGGISLPEVLVASGIVAVGLVAMLAGFQVATGGVTFGRHHSMAVFLAEQRLEQLKATAMTDFASLTAGTTTEGYNSIPNAANYRRSTTITDSPGGIASTKLIQVTVFYRRLEAGGMASWEGSLVLSTLVAAHQ